MTDPVTYRPTEVAGYLTFDAAALDDPPQLASMATNELDALLDHCAARDAPGATIGERRHQPAEAETDVHLSMRQRMENDAAADEGREPVTLRRLAFMWGRADLHWPER